MTRSGADRDGAIPPDRRRIRSRLAGASVAVLGAGALVPMIELRGPAAAGALVAAVVATLLQTAHVTREAVGQTAAVVIALVPSAFGPLDATVPRVTVLAGAVLVFAGAELARLSLDQRTRVPGRADPPGEAWTASMAIAGLGALAAVAVFVLGLIDLDSAGVLAALGAIAAVTVAAVIAHPRAMLGSVLSDEDTPDEDVPDQPDGAVSPPRAARDAGR